REICFLFPIIIITSIYLYENIEDIINNIRKNTVSLLVINNSKSSILFERLMHLCSFVVITK
ncbi:MAG TPA: hypothetical protein VGK47_02590, partial [Nitrososphaeraceae archaeon]